MSWFDSSGFSSFAKSAFEGAQRSIDKVLDIEEGSGNASQANKTESSAPIKKSKLGAKQTAKSGTRTQKTISPPKSSSQRGKPTKTNNDADSSSSGDFWSSFLGGYGGSNDSSTSSSTTSSSTTSSSTTSSSTTSSSTAASSSATASTPRASKQSLQNDRLEHKVSDTSLSDKRRERIQNKKKTKENVPDSKSTKQENLEKEENASSSNTEKHPNLDVGSEKENASNYLKHDVSEREVQTSESDNVLTPAKCINQDHEESFAASRELQVHDESAELLSIVETQSTNDVDSATGTPDILQNIGSKPESEGDIENIRTKREEHEMVSTSRNSEGAKTILSTEKETDLQRSVGSKNEVSRVKGPDMVEGLQEISDSENQLPPEDPAPTAADRLSLDLVCDNSLVNKTQEIEPDLKPVDASTPYPSKHTGPFETSSVEAVSTNVKLNEEIDGTEGLNLDKEITDVMGNITVKEETRHVAETSEESASVECKLESEESGSELGDHFDEEKEGSLLKAEEDVLPEQQLSQEQAPFEECETSGEFDNELASGQMDNEPAEAVEQQVKEVTDEVASVELDEKENVSPEAVSGDDSKTAVLKREIASLKEVVEAREKKMVELSKNNIDLQETNTILKSQMSQLESLHTEEDTELDKIREEFTIRVAATENKLQAAARERDQLKKELEDTTNHLTAVNERQHEEFTVLISEKDEQITELLTEGEKLSKQELQSNTIIKKLRAKEKENDALIKKQTKKNEDLETEVKQLTEVLTSRDDSQCKQEDAIIKLDAYVKKQNEQIAKQTSELDDASEKIRSLQTTLDNAYKELTELHKDKATKESIAQDAVLSAGVNAREELRIALERARREFYQESETMALQIADLQASLSRAEQQGTRREDSLRQEISDLQERLQEADGRNQELATSVSQATRPLLRQIEHIQSTHSNQTSTWEKVERSLTERLNEAQAQLLAAQEKERLASQNASQIQSRISGLESQVSSYRADRSRLEAELELERTKIRTLEDTLSREAAKAEASHSKFKKLLVDANQDKAHAEQQLTVEKSRMETERKKLKTAMDEKERRISRQSSFGSFPPPSPTTPTEPTSQIDSTDSTSQRGHTRMSSTGSSVVDGFARGMIGGATATVVERLQAQVKAKEGEVDLLQDDLAALEKSRDSVTEELAQLTIKLEGLETSYQELVELRSKHQELEQRYNAVLQMYGEKEEEAEELRMDLHDVKSMYKQQLEQLFGTR